MPRGPPSQILGQIFGAFAVRCGRREAWLEENREAIESYNVLVARDGVLSDKWRKF